jgi:hypothetical protein
MKVGTYDRMHVTGFTKTPKNGGKGGNRTHDPGIMSADALYRYFGINNLQTWCAGFCGRTYVYMGHQADDSRHTGETDGEARHRTRR